MTARRDYLLRVLAAIALAAGVAGLVRAARPNAPEAPPTARPALPTAQPDAALRDRLGGVAFVPERADLDPLLGDQPALALIELAVDDAIDPGVRLRALRALALYPSPETATLLEAVVGSLRDAEQGVELLYLAASMQSLAAVAGEDAVASVRPVLDHPSKDARAAAARALGASGASSAKKWLYERFSIETDAMVRLALGDAIRALDEN